MSQFLQEGSVLLHTLATVVFIGYYLLLAFIVLPALKAQPDIKAAGSALSAISRRSRAWLYAALIVFAISGAYLTLVDPNYRGLGNFSNPWALAMLAKHTLIFVMLVLGFWFNTILRVGPLASSNTGVERAFGQFRSHANTMAALGLAVLILTAFSQGQ